MSSTREEILNVLHHYKLTHQSAEGRGSLIPLLQAIQEKFGYLSRESMEEVGRFLQLPVSKVYGVATFFNQFRFKFFLYLFTINSTRANTSQKIKSRYPSFFEMVRPERINRNKINEATTINIPVT